MSHNNFNSGNNSFFIYHVLFINLYNVFLQLYLLAAKPSKLVTALFRLQLNFMNGPLLAFVFPETESRIVSLNSF